MRYVNQSVEFTPAQKNCIIALLPDCKEGGNMSKNIKGNQKHLTLSDRHYIEHSIRQGNSFRQIAIALGKDPSTISKEVKLHRRAIKNNDNRKNDCVFIKTCRHHFICGNSTCMITCRMCKSKSCHDYCSRYTPFSCTRLTSPPYVCNGCKSALTCKGLHYYYYAKESNSAYLRNLSGSRNGINLTPEELESLDNLVTPLIKKGQPLGHIFSVHGEDICCSRRTLYNYLGRNILTARNIDLPRRVRYKARRYRKQGFNDIKQSYRNRRTYKDFERFMEEHPDFEIVEMDTVKGCREVGKVMLTLLFRSSSFMLIFLLKSGTQECVAEVFNNLTDLLGVSLFRKTFPVILTDNGPEFKAPSLIEKTPDGRHRTYVFYCDPYVSNQKARLEKNHEFIRYVVPKGRSFYNLSQDDTTLISNHINSLARDNLNGKTPFDLAYLLLDKKVLASLELEKVSPDEVLLKPALVKK